MLFVIAVSCALIVPALSQAESTPLLIDTHIHYSHDAWVRLPPEKAIEVLKEAGLKKAFVSSSSDDGTQMLYTLDSELIVPVLRPYRRRGEVSSWMHDESVVAMLEKRLSENYYAGIGEFHAFDDDIKLPVLVAVMDLAKHYGIFLHAHSDAAAVRNIFAYNPDAIVLWAHSGFESSFEVATMLEQYPNLWADLAFRFEHVSNGRVTQEWLDVFNKFPDRFMLGTDTYTPERWYFVVDHADENREWLSALPEDLAENIGWRNAEKLLSRTRAK